jgi:hypothetical protein
MSVSGTSYLTYCNCSLSTGPASAFSTTNNVEIAKEFFSTALYTVKKDMMEKSFKPKNTVVKCKKRFPTVLTSNASGISNFS